MPLIVPDRDAIATLGRRQWGIRHKQAGGRPLDIGTRSLPWVITQFIADVLIPVYAIALSLDASWSVRNRFGADLETTALELGLEGRKLATGAIGYVVASQIAAGGSSIENPDELLHEPTGVRFKVSVTNVYQDGDPIQIEAIDPGPESNLAQGSILRFRNPRPGCGEFATIQGQNDGTGTITGLTGGRNAESDIELQDRIIDRQSNPPASGNDAQIIDVAQKLPGVPVEKAWVIPAWYGPGTSCVLFTVRPDAKTGSRLPTTAQRGKMQTHLQANFATDWGLTVGALQTKPLAVVLAVTFRQGASAFVDPTPWPPVNTGVVGAILMVVDGAVAPTTSTMRVKNAMFLAGTCPNPEIGQTIALYDISTNTFAKKRIANVIQIVAGSKWDLVFDFTAAASDTLLPTAGQIVSPWATTLNAIPPAVTSTMRGLGPGEQFAVFKDPGMRQKRIPLSPGDWSSVVSNADMVSAVKATRAVSDVDMLLPLTPHATPVGVPGVLSNLLQLSDLAVYPQ